MRLLFDQNLSFRLCAALADIYPHSEQVTRLGLDRADDRLIWRYAREHGFTIVSQDADYAELASWLGPPPKVIWLRSGNQPWSAVARSLRSAASVIELFNGTPNAACLELY